MDYCLEAGLLQLRQVITRLVLFIIKPPLRDCTSNSPMQLGPPFFVYF